ncbi:hypothetical protein CLAFUW4_12730 [Fulvia fulva]|uniref:Uncharacterized protein n=1 Tax=Passalora fulva TaxID=5499 RepID=A0A9Q8PJ75_PASFU|nr:uncharacterized protein CLAFUR5_12596 [Fulvia fulva]KAK4612224.1 hypothetical protein CLAFUR4_12734 [Fulvia fulva]KAK4612806.1 hypothetical protein CLAFUR0_12741 [Fulvia fulva]UJO23458.1 hypothetical protein CLAFUR5_12596 [Fulvia fulva]WPV21161.1 hypothetical protein CLAFUW4_12730 [Fulvia fulva]WPV36514.1 hypothetical protein CLAFUW7_12737 [Fulvia fulva]
MAYNSSLSLPDCASITASTPCAPCFFGGRTSLLSFPYTLTSTVTVTVYPVYTGYPGSSTFVSYETDSITVTLSEDGKPIPTFGADLTWEVDGVTLTSGTTYASFANFSGAAPAHTIAPYNRRDAVVKTSTSRVLPYQYYPSTAPSAGSRPGSFSNKTCIGVTDTKSITLPATVDPSSFIIPITTTSGAESQLTYGVLPSQVIQYLDGLSTVREQMNGSTLETCSPTTYPSASPIVCTYVTTISSQTSSATSSCATTTRNGTQTSMCTVPVYNPPPGPYPPKSQNPSTATVTATQKPPVPPPAPYSSSVVSKTSGLSILTETGTNRLRLPTAGGGPPSRETQGESVVNPPVTKPPYSGPTGGVSPPDSGHPKPGDGPSHDEQPHGHDGGQGTQPGNAPHHNDQPSDDGGGQNSQPGNEPPSNNQHPGDQGDTPVNGATIHYGTSPFDQNPHGTANTYIPPLITTQGTTYTPKPIIYTSSGRTMTYYAAPAIATISGTAVTYHPNLYIATENGVAVTYYPPAAVDSTSRRPPSYLPITIPPTEQGCTATVTVTYSPVMAGNLTETGTRGVGDYINTGIDSGNAGVSSTAPPRQTNAASKDEGISWELVFWAVTSVLAGLHW